jgi:hypothetical protein
MASVVLFLSPAPTAAPFTWEGVYRVEGANPGGKKYEGYVQVAAVPETALYEIAWLTNGAEELVLGVGFEYDERLVVTGTNVLMFASYKRNGDGRWLLPGAKSPLPEKWSRTKYKTLSEVPHPTPTKQPQAETVDGREA